MDVHSQADADPSAVPSADEIDAISSRRFSSSFRGWNADEVRVHLVEIAEMVRGLARRHGELQRQLTEAEAAVRRADLTRLDPDEVGRVLGEETARVLRAARESAAEIEAKARAQAELLASQAADDAARVRAEARDDAERVRAEAEETASAVRTAGSAHVEDLRAAAEAELADERAAMTDRLAEEREVLHAEIAALRAAAVDEAADIRRVAESDAEAVRTEANRYAEALHSEADADAAQLRSNADEDARDVTARAAGQVADAERLRDRILTDLARKRRAARQHLEQLHAGRDRLLRAYEVILATSDEAMAELDVVLPDAKRTADEAARRIAAEPLPSSEELLAELQEARERDPSMGRPVPISEPAPESDEVTDDTDTGVADTGDGADPTDPGEPTGAVSAVVVPAEGEVDDAPDGPATGDVPAGPVPDPNAATTGGEAPVRANGPEPIVPVPEVDADPIAARAPHRRSGRRGKRRHDPLGGDALPDVPMVPVAAAAEFESVRVMSSAEAAEVTGSTGAVASSVEELESPEPTDDRRAGSSSPMAADPRPASPARAPAPPTSTSRAASGTGRAADGAAVSGPAVAPSRREPAPGAAEAESGAPSTRAASGPGTGPTTPSTPSTASTRERSDDAVTDIFARLRADRARETGTGETPPGTGETPAGTGERAPVSGSDAEVAADAPDPESPGSATGRTGPDSDGTGSAAGGDAPAVRGNGSPQGTPPTRSTSPKTTPGKIEPRKIEPGKIESGKTPTAQRPGGKTTSAPDAKPGTSKKPAEEANLDEAAVAALFERRDAAVDDAARLLSKHLKRTLSDQQSELLDRLRRTKGPVTPETLIGEETAFTDGWDTMIRDDLTGAVEAGVALVADLRPGTPTGVTAELSDVVTEVVETIATPLRSRLSRVLDEDVVESADADDGDDEREIADRIRACYREWRGARLTSAVSDVCARAFGLGVRAAVPDDVDLHWYCGPGAAPCSDCNDNRLAGGVPAGETFPTGRSVAPAHPGCRCLALPLLD